MPTATAIPPSPDEVGALLERVRTAQGARQFDEALALADQAWRLTRAGGHIGEQIEAGRLCCQLLLRRGQLREMLGLADYLLPLLRNGEPTAALCEVLRWCALAGADVGEFETAMAAANEGCATAQVLGDTKLKSMALNSLGAVFERMGDPWQAERLMTEAADLLREQAGSFEQLVALNNLWAVTMGRYHLLHDTGHEAECQLALQRALHLAQTVRPQVSALGDVFGMALCDSHLGEVLLHQGRRDEAETYLEQASAQTRQYGFLALAGRVGGLQAQLALARGQADAAYAALGHWLDQAPQISGLDTRRLHYMAYRCCKALGLGEGALAHLEAYQTLERRRNGAQLMAQSRYMATRIEAEYQRGPADAARRNALDGEDLRDPLTGLGNRRCMEARLPLMMQETRQDGLPLTLALIDIDRFQGINETHGSAVGDRVLQVLAQMLRDNTRGSDLLLRHAGEEFLVALPDTVPDRAFEVCERLRQGVESFDWNGIVQGLDVTLSIGLATAPPHSTDLLIARADSAMYRAKHLGRNRVALA